MRIILFVLIIQSPFALPLWPQHYGVVGTGVTLNLYDSAELNHFRRTYNAVNGPNMSQLLSGFDNYVGLRFEGGYRYVGYRLTTAVLLGWRRLTSSGNGLFNNGDSRNFRIHSDAFYLEGEAGRVWGNLFVSGMLTLFFNRNINLKSSYSNVSGSDYVERLDGAYKAKTFISGDLGLAVGIQKNRTFLIGKISHPVFASNQADRLRDADPQKVVDGSDHFPDDFIKFTNREPYSGVRNKLDGWKISIVLAFAFKIVI
jgi:hypothetical protein